MKKRIIYKYLIYILILASLIFCNFRCSSIVFKNQDNSIMNSNQKKIVDCLNREVIIDKNPKNIAAIFSPAVHTIAILGGSEKIHSVSLGNMRDRLLLEIYPKIANARTPKGGGQFNIEEMIKEPSPDIIICDTATVNDKRIMNKIEKFRIPVIAYGFKNIDEQKYAIRMIGEIIDKQSKADEYCKEIDKAVKEVSNRINSSEIEKNKTIYHAVNELLRGDIEPTVPVEVIKTLGLKQKGVSSISGFNDRKNYINLEDLFSYDPDYIIVNGEDVYDYINQNERLHVLKAWKSSNIYNLPTGISRWGQPNSIETALFVKWLAKTIYPEMFKDIDMEREVKDFYKKFTDKDLNYIYIEDILSGRNLRGIEKSNRKKDGV